MSITEIEAPRLDIKMLKQIDRVLEELYETGHTVEAGNEMVSSGLKKNQVRGLENLIAATTRFSEIINYIKNQIGKRRREWQSTGPLLLSQLETIEAKAAEIAGENPAIRMDIKLRLARGWARQVVAHFLYNKMEEGDAPS